MNLQNKTSIELAKIYAMGDAPDPLILLKEDQTDCEWRVDMLTGPIPNLGGKFFRHRKRFIYSCAVATEIDQEGNAICRYSGPMMVYGHNTFFAKTRWGWFRVDNPESDGISATVLNYGSMKCVNGCLISRIENTLRTTVSKDVLLGKSFYNLGKRELGPYFFSLTRL